jgi:pyrroloquinoline quinone biosynthesis protein E
MLFTLTNKCNFRCIYCYNSSGNARENELSTEEWLDLIKQADEIGVKKVSISGGEPFCHPGALDIIKELKKRKILIELATNGGVEYPPEIFELMSNEKVQISLDTADSSVFTELCSVNGFETVRKNIKLFVDKKAFVTIKACMTNKNYKGIPDLYDLLFEIGVNNIGLAAYVNGVNGRGGDSLLLSENNISELIDIFNTIEQYESTIMYQAIPESVWKKKEDITMCGALFQAMIVQPNGDVTGCEQMAKIDELNFGNIRNNTIMEIWLGKKADEFHYRKSHPSDPHCRECIIFDECQTGCFADKYYHGISMYGKDIRCQIN